MSLCDAFPFRISLLMRQKEIVNSKNFMRNCQRTALRVINQNVYILPCNVQLRVEVHLFESQQLYDCQFHCAHPHIADVKHSTSPRRMYHILSVKSDYYKAISMKLPAAIESMWSRFAQHCQINIFQPTEDRHL